VKNTRRNKKSGADETHTGLLVAERYGMPERTFKRWLSTSLFRKNHPRLL
jgi:hypothetical protein